MKINYKRGILMIIFAIITIVISLMVIKNLKVPTGLGEENGRLAPLGSSPNGVSSQSDKNDRYINPIPFKDNLEKTRGDILKALKDYGNIEIITQDENYIHAVSKSKILRFRDDIELYLDKNLKVIHYRSKSRTGYSDMGLNRKRYDSLVKLYNR